MADFNITLYAIIPEVYQSQSFLRNEVSMDRFERNLAFNLSFTLLGAIHRLVNSIQLGLHCGPSLFAKER